MRVLIDECLPKQLKAWLGNAHDTSTVQEAGWTSVNNGRLLKLANAAGFDAFVTADQNMYKQQNFAGLKLSLLVIPTNRKLLVRSYVPALLQALERLQQGQFVVL